jgi:hypothetical protein
MALAVVFALQAAAGTAVALEMTTDARYRAEAWLRTNVDRHRTVLTCLAPHIYLPRARWLGYATDLRIGGGEGNVTGPEALGHQPELVLLSEAWYTDPLFFDLAFAERLLAGTAGYRRAAEFGPRWLPPAGGVLSPALWGLDRPLSLSPTIVIMHLK